MNKKLEVTNLINPLLSTLKIASNEIKSLLEIGIPEYLHNQTDKYYFTNTFLHRAEKVLFEKVYFPISAKYNHLITRFSNLSDVFDEYKYITLVGSAGSGKSTLVKHLFLESIKQSYKIPVLIELRKLNDYEGDLFEFITSKLIRDEVKPSVTTLTRALKKGAFLFLFDGYDEIFSERKQKTSSDIESFVDKYSENKYLISTRPGSGVERAQRFHSFEVEDLSDDQIVEFLDQLVVEEERRLQIKINIKDPNSSDYSEYLKNPLLLSMFILAFESHPEIPKRKSAFYKNVFDTLYSKHDGVTKGSFPREKKTRLQREDFEELLSVLSFLTISEGQFAFTEEYLSSKLSLIKKKKRNIDFSIEDLIFDFRTSISILIKDGFEYKFPHRSMQEYFTAVFLEGLPTSKKEKAYNKLNDIFENLSEDRSLNFWILCKELDLSSYLNFFALKVLKDARDSLEGKKGVNLLNAFNKLWKPTFYIGNMEGIGNKLNAKDFKELTIYRHQSLYSILIDFEEVYDFHDFSEFTNNPQLIDLISKLYLKEHSKASGIMNFVVNSKVKIILVENGIDRIISSYLNSISNKISEFEKLISSTEEDLDDLIDS